MFSKYAFYQPVTLSTPVEENDVVIRLQGSVLTIETQLPGDIINTIADELSFVLPSARFSYSNSPFAGTVRLFNKKKRTTFVGFIPRICELLINRGFNPRVNFLDKKPKSNSVYLYPKKNNEIQFRDYQKEVILASKEHVRGIVSLPTGAGKTITAAGIISYLNVKNNLFIVPNLDLLEQTKSAFESFFQIPIGMIGGNIWDLQPITVATVQTIIAKLKNEDGEEKKEELLTYLESVENLIIDESHHVAAESLQTICTGIDSYYKFGVSATPNRDDKQDLKIEGALSNIFYIKTAAELIDAGYLLQPRFYIYKTKKHPTGVKDLAYMSAYKQEITTNDSRNNLIVSIASKFIKSNHTCLIVVNTIEHGEILFSKMEDLGLHSFFVRGKVDSITRKKVIQQLKDKEIANIICTSKIGSEGLDVPSLDCLINAAAGKSESLSMQRIGRTIRTYPGKERAYVIDFKDEYGYFLSQSRKRIKVYVQEFGKENIFEIDPFLK